jgi:hypothetical protein
MSDVGCRGRIVVKMAKPPSPPLARRLAPPRRILVLPNHRVEDVEGGLIGVGRVRKDGAENRPLPEDAEITVCVSVITPGSLRIVAQKDLVVGFQNPSTESGRYK